MFVEVNHPRHVVMVRPPVSTFNDQSWRRLFALSKSVVIVTEDPIADWKSITSIPFTFLPWRQGFVSDVLANIRFALEAAGSEPHFAISVCFEPDDLPAAVLTRTGTVRFGGPLFGTLPDLLINDISDLVTHLDEKRGTPLGFLGEQRCSIDSYGQPISKSGRLFWQRGVLRSNPLLDASSAERLQVAMMGRFFNSEDHRRAKHQYTYRMRQFKKRDPRGNVVSKAFASTLAVMFESVGFDLITRVPPRPNETDRLGEQLIEATRLTKGATAVDLGSMVSLDAVGAHKTFGAQKTLSRAARAANVQGVFSGASFVRGRRILLVDDVLTTGATLVECARSLFQGGAADVTALALCVTQHAIPTDLDEMVPCPSCADGHLVMRVSSTGMTNGFWGCSDWYKTNCGGSAKWSNGLRDFNRMTRVDRIDASYRIDF